ncbi:hypothetical protein [Candidatus Nanohalococcus occultus]|uniref:Uncharacterized protein n=1 Tax=Candidatus Nanohalococcus occultus TaxID=2978047 RepID=A0ABY8CCS3_9ARCH|nr:hypothetical protein SVXNc_0005 [Candidatus Nanohaloarchaeota archaeon SVXNc]
MKIVEEVGRRRQTLVLDDPGRAYAEIRDLLERRMSFDEVREEQYFNDVDEGTIRSKITTVEGYDKRTVEQLDITLYISKQQRELEIQIRAKMVTEYNTNGPWGTLWWYAYLALYDKFLYGKNRHHWEGAMEEKADELLHRVRENVEAT